MEQDIEGFLNQIIPKLCPKRSEVITCMAHGVITKLRILLFI